MTGSSHRMNTARVRPLLALTACCWLACEARAPEPRFRKEPSPSSAADRTQAAQPVHAEPARNEAQHAATAQAAPAPAEAAPPARLVRRPTTPDPLNGKFELSEAVKGLPKKGTLRATIDTGMGALECTLYENKTPKTVANFVGLARGLRPFWDAKSAAWVTRPLFDGTSFHRAIPDFMIQGGDHLGDGTGQVGYEIPDELVGLAHDRPGLLCMANRGPNTNGGQFFITDAPAPHLTQMGTYTIFGECTPHEVIHRIARAPRPYASSERPDPVVPIRNVTITRK